MIATRPVAAGSRAAIPALALALALALAFLAALGCARPERLNLLVVTFDTTRADALGPYGHPAGHTPTLDRLAAEGTVFEQCVSAVPITAPSHSTLFTGTYPPHHGVRDNGVFVLPNEVTTLAEVLRDAGYRTGAAIGAFPLVARFGLDQGFELYDDRIEDPIAPLLGLAKPDLFFDERSATEVNAALLPWLDEVAGEPFFAWLHYWEPHHPHHPPQPYAQLYEYDPYLAEIAYADEALGRILEWLDEHGELERTVVVMTSDHGEGRGEHREETHSMLAYNATLRVPLIVRAPGLGGGRRGEQRVGTVDLVPTVLDLLGVEAPTAVQGRSLAPLLADDPAAAEGPRPYYAETLSPRVAHGWSELRALYHGDHKYIFGARPELFDLRSDFDELEDLAAERPTLAAELDENLRRFVARLSNPDVAARAAVDADEETRRRLAALGYLATAGEALGAERLSAEGPAPQDRVEEITRVSQVKSLLAGGEAWAAQRQARQLVAADGANPYYRELLGRALLLQGRPREALAAVEPVGATSEGLRYIYLHVAQLEIHAGRLDEAEAILRQVLSHEDHSWARFEMAAVSRARGEVAAAANELERALALEPDLALARLDLGVLRLQQGDLSAAEAHLRRTATELPLLPQAHYRLGALHLARAEPAAARARFERAVELAPTACYPRVGLADALHAMGQDDAAREVLAELLLGCDDTPERGGLEP